MAGIGAVVAGGRRGGGSLVRFREQAADPIVAGLGRGVELFEQVRHGHGRMPPLGPIVARIVAVSPVELFQGIEIPFTGDAFEPFRELQLLVRVPGPVRVGVPTRVPGLVEQGASP